jgi:hypothetical protein
MRAFNEFSLAVLISTYSKDNPSRLASALDSVFTQLLPSGYNIHVYLSIDGAISDHHEDVIRKYGSSIYRIIRSDRNLGLASMLNRLILELEDENYVFRMDADDISFPLRFAKQIDFLCHHPDIDIVGANIIEYDSQSGSRRLIGFPHLHADAYSRMCYRVPFAHPTVCFRRSVFSIVSGYPLENGNEDLAMWFACAKAGLKFGNVQEALLEFYIDINFWQRRGVAKCISEFSCYVAGIHSLYGFTWKYIFPFARLLFRLGPAPLVKFVYGGFLRVKSQVSTLA